MPLKTYLYTQTSSLPLHVIGVLLAKLRRRSALAHSVLITLLRTDRRCRALDGNWNKKNSADEKTDGSEESKGKR